MRRPSARLTIAPALAASVLLLGTACSSSPDRAVLTGAAPSTPSAPITPLTPPTRSAPGPDPASVARQDAAALLAAFAAPSGAARSATEPVGTPSVLDQPALHFTATTIVTSTGWWVVDEGADSVYSWLTSHDASAMKQGLGYMQGSGVLDISYDEPATAVLTNRHVAADIAPLSPGRSVIRVTVQEIYRPVKPTAEVVPASAYLLATLQPATFGLAAKPTPSAKTVTVTDRSKIAEIAGLINALPTLPDEILPCPSDSGARIRLDFKTAVNGTTLAAVVIKPGGCASVSVSIAGTEEPALDPDAATYSGGLDGRISSILGESLS